tara:strand:- start:1002 stop:1211 length:210 start_codon:yes stop_codon:yes gene_type:complete
MKNFSVRRQLTTLARTFIGKLYKGYKEKTKPSFIQVDVPSTCKSWKERRKLLSITRKFLEQNIKIINNE